VRFQDTSRRHTRGNRREFLRRISPRILWLCLFFTLSLPVDARVEIRHWVAQSGARVYFVETHALPIVDVAVEFSAGSAYDPRDRAGLGRLTLAMLKAGSARYSEVETGRRIADSGADLRSSFDVDRAGFSLRVLSSEAERTRAMETLAEMLQAPRFPAEALERERARAVANAREGETQPDRIAEKRLYALIYPAHPYGFSASPETLAPINREDVERHYRLHYGSTRAVVTIVGDIDRVAAQALAESLTSRLAPGADSALPPVTPAPGGEVARIAHPSAQSHVVLGLAALSYGDPDYFPLLVGNHILGGGGFVSRLTKEVRSRQGYAYSVYSYFRPAAREGPFLVGLQTRRDQANDALKRTLELVAEFVARGPTAAELAAAKKSMMGGFPLRYDTNRKVLDQVAAIGFYRLPLDWLDAYPAKVQGVTLAQVRDAFERRVVPAKLSIVVVGAPD
jgi:zinc protease